VLTELLVQRFVSGSARTTDPAVRRRYGALEGWTSVVINLVVFVIKLVPGLAIGSIALLADAFHSLGDVASSLVIIWGFRAAAKPSDRKHPFGHGRVESIAALVIAVLLLVAAVEFGKLSVQRSLSQRGVEASWTLLVVLALSLVLKEWLSRFALALGRRIGSTALVADYWHHRSDVLATGVVIAALALDRYGFDWIDGAAGLVVAGFLAWAGINLVREAADPLIGEAPPVELLGRIRATAGGVLGVERVHDVIVHRYGELIVTSLHVEVPAALDIMRGHEIAEEVEGAITTELGGWATVHVDPVDRDHPLYHELEGFITQEVRRVEGASVHDLRVVGREAPCFVIFELAASEEPRAEQIVQLRQAVMARFPAVAKVVVNLEPRYVF